MKRTVLLLAFMAVLSVWVVRSRMTPPVRHQDPAQTPTPTEPGTQSPDYSKHTVSAGGQTFAYFVLTSAPDRISLIPNYGQKKEFTALLDGAGCTSGINAGFYDTDDKPLGMIVADGSTLHGSLHSALLNGYFSLSGQNIPSVSEEEPENPRIAVQNGPVLTWDSRARTLSINNDKFARRMAVAVTGDQRVLFITVFDPESVFEGPLLADMPSVLDSIAARESLPIVSAMNLDGGTASAFRSPEAELSELKPVGAAFCIR